MSRKKDADAICKLSAVSRRRKEFYNCLFFGGGLYESVYLLYRTIVTWGFLSYKNCLESNQFVIISLETLVKSLKTKRKQENRIV